MSGRKQEVVVAQMDLGRDATKHFLITEMPATQAEKWAMKMLLLLRGSGERIPDNVQGLGMIGVAILGINVFLRGQIDPEKLMPLMDEMMTCVQMIRDPKRPDIPTPMVGDDDVQEVKTLLWLRSEVIRVHTGFSPAVALSSFLLTIQAAAESDKSNSPNTQTSPGQ